MESILSLRALGKDRLVRHVGALGASVSTPLATRQISQPELWCDTSETLSLVQYQYLASKGYRGCFRYVPLSGGGGGISASEVQAALSVKCPDGTGFALQFVQFSRTSGISASTGTLDGQAAANYLKTLGVPNTVCMWQDLSPAVLQSCIDYSNASFAAMVATHCEASAPGMYAEPGYPLTAAQRYSSLHLHRYWATAANDPNKWVSSRGCQVIQAWASSSGQFSPEAGLIIDGDFVQADYFVNFPVCLIAGS